MLTLPILIPLLGAALLYSLRLSSEGSSRLMLSAAIVNLGAVLLLGWHVEHHGLTALQVGGWPVPAGIVLLCDRLAVLMLTVTAIVFLASALYASSSDDRPDAVSSLLQLGLLGGINGAFLASDIFNLFVWFEVVLICTVLLLAGGRSLRAAAVYTYPALLGSLLFLLGAALTYAQFGTLNIYQVGQAVFEKEVFPFAAIPLIVCFGLKAAVFPFYFWLPVSYPQIHPAVSAFFAGILTKLGVYAILRLVTCWLYPFGEVLSPALLAISVLTMVGAVLAAMSRSTFREILSFHIASQVGFMLLGIALWGASGFAAAIFYLAHHVLVKAALFLTAGIAEQRSRSSSVFQSGGLLLSSPLLSFLFGVSALSLSGFPPLSGFFAKLSVLYTTLQEGFLLVLGFALLSGLFTAVSMLKIWNEAYWKPARSRSQNQPMHDESFDGRYLGAGLLVCGSILIGIAPSPLWEFCQAAAESLLEPGSYLAAFELLGSAS